MLDWHSFSKAARECVVALNWNDSELLLILSRAEPPPRNVDEIGRPLRGSWLANQHPDPESYRRVIGIRRNTSTESEDAGYIAYAERILQFLSENFSTLDRSGLFIVVIMTSNEEYEFLYVPHSHSILAQMVSRKSIG